MLWICELSEVSFPFIFLPYKCCFIKMQFIFINSRHGACHKTKLSVPQRESRWSVIYKQMFNSGILCDIWIFCWLWSLGLGALDWKRCLRNLFFYDRYLPSNYRDMLILKTHFHILVSGKITIIHLCLCKELTSVLGISVKELLPISRKRSLLWADFLTSSKKLACGWLNKSSNWRMFPV